MIRRETPHFPASSSYFFSPPKDSPEGPYGVGSFYGRTGKPGNLLPAWKMSYPRDPAELGRRRLSL